MIQGRVGAGGVGDQEAAAQAGGAQLLRRLVRRDHAALDSEVALLEREIGRRQVVLGLVPDRQEAAPVREMAIDCVPADEVDHMVVGALRFAVHAHRRLGADFALQLAEAGQEPAPDEAGVARAGTHAGLARFEDDDIAPRLRQGERRREARIAGTDHGDIGRRGQGIVPGRGRPRRLPPPGVGGEIRRQVLAGHPIPLRHPPSHDYRARRPGRPVQYGRAENC